MTTDIPVIETERLVLRAPMRSDFDLLAEIYASDRARYMGGPFSRRDAWRFWCAAVASWMLCGFGYWTVEQRRTNGLVGFVGLAQPIENPERELGWEIRADYEGQGYAFEAAAAARDHAFEALGWETLVSYVDPGNARSIALAERLGAVRDPAAHAPDPTDIVFRHLHPAAKEESTA